MSDINQGFAIPEQKPKLPSGLNVLTILSIIGSILGLFGGIYQYFGSQKNLENMEKTINSPEFENMPGFVKSMMSPEALEMARKAYENRLPIALIYIVSSILCLVGVLQMRKLKKQGYPLYVVGEVLPFIGNAIFMGIASLTAWTGLLGIAIAALFIILYTNQRKHLIY